MEPFETFEHAGFTVELHQDDLDPMSPGDWDQLGTLVLNSPTARNYIFSGSRETTGAEDDALTRGGFPLLSRYLQMTEGAVAIAFTLQDYGSGGLQLYEDRNPGADENIDGFFVTTPDRVTQLCGDSPEYHTREWIEKALRSELSEWAAYAEGNVIGYVVRDPETGEVIDSCWSFYPESPGRGTDPPTPGDEWEYVREQARDIAEYTREERDAETANLNAGRAARIRSL